MHYINVQFLKHASATCCNIICLFYWWNFLIELEICLEFFYQYTIYILIIFLHVFHQTFKRMTIFVKFWSSLLIQIICGLFQTRNFYLAFKYAVAQFRFFLLLLKSTFFYTYFFRKFIFGSNLPLSDVLCMCI